MREPEAASSSNAGPEPHAPVPRQSPRHFYSLDALRGLAALSIVFYHWHHFFEIGNVIHGFDETRQPCFLS